MISAFGVEHTISKSFVNGKFVSASALSAKQASKVRSGGQWKKARGVSQKDTKFREMMTGPDVKGFASTASGIKIDREATRGLKSVGQGGTIRLGSKREGRSYVSGVAGSKKVQRAVSHHEAEHALPKRSSYRLHGQILGNKGKMMREEARADWHSMGHYSNPKNLSGYAAAARATGGKPGGKYAFSPADKEQIRGAGMKPKKLSLTNRDAADASLGQINQQIPHYRLKQKDFKAYRKLQDDLQQRNVPQRKRNFGGS